MFKGVYTALITPFKDNRIDENNFASLIERQKKNNVSGIVIGGCTGESFSLTLDEKIQLTRIAVKYKSEGFMIIVGTGASSTDETIKQSGAIESLGVDALLLITPFGNKPSQEGLYRHFKTVAENVSAPVMLYNVPGRTGVNLLPETVAGLAEIKNIKALKQANSDVDLMTKTLALAPGIDLLSGEDSLTLPLLAMGGNGVVSTVSNVIPKIMADLCDSYFSGNIEKSRTIHKDVLPLIKSLFLESNPMPLKYALKSLNVSNGELRLPLVDVQDPTKKTIDLELKKLKDKGYEF